MNRIDVINKIIQKKNLRSYLEIGVSKGESFNRIICDRKKGVDPAPADKEYSGEIYKMTSDEFFKQNETQFDIIFVDGLHLYEQTVLDMVNGFQFLNTNGFIVLHDCLPESEQMAGRIDCGLWTGDVYKAIFWFKDLYSHVPCFVLKCDYGCGVIHKTSRMNIYDPNSILSYNDLDYIFLMNNLNKLNIKSPDYLEEYLKGN